MKKFRWPFVKRTTFENAVSLLEQYEEFATNSMLENHRKLGNVKARCSDLEASLEKEETYNRDREKDILDILGIFVPVRWEPQYHRGYYVTHICQGEHCKQRHQNGQYVFGNFPKFVSEITQKIASGWRPHEAYCNDCTPFLVENIGDGKWRVVTAYCGYGGCDAEYQDFNSESDAQEYAKKLYDSGRRVNWNGLCSECAHDYYENCI